MHYSISPPKDEAMTSACFLSKLGTRIKYYVQREIKARSFSLNPKKYKRVGLDKYMNKDKETLVSILIPRVNPHLLEDIAKETFTKIEISKNYMDRCFMVIMVSGTITNVKDVEEELKFLLNNDMKEYEGFECVKHLCVPTNKEHILGKNKTRIYEWQRQSKARIDIAGKNEFNETIVMIAGYRDACDKALGLIIDHLLK